MNLLAVTTGNIIDIVAIALILIITVSGLVKGFVKTFFSTFGTLIGLLLAVILSANVVTFMQDKFGIVTAVSDGITGFLTNIFGDIMTVTISEATEDAMSQAGISAWLIQIVLSLQTGNDIPTDVSLSQIICPVFGYYIAMILAIIVLFILFKIIFYIIGEIISKCKSIKIIYGLDKVLGFALGFVKGVIIVEFIIMIIGAVPLGFCQTVITELSNAPFSSFINDINLYGIILNNISLPDITAFITGLIN